MKTFNEIYNEYYAKILNKVKGKVTNNLDAEEITQDIFVKIHKGLNYSYDESKAELTTWMFHITTNAIIDFFRAKKQVETQSIYDTDKDGNLKLIVTPTNWSNPHAIIVGSETMAKVQKSFRAIKNTKMRRVANLYFNHEMKYNEIVERTGLKLGTVKANINRAREVLQAELLA